MSLPVPASTNFCRPATFRSRSMLSLPPKVEISSRSKPVPSVTVPPFRVTVVAVELTASTSSLPRMPRVSKPPAPPLTVKVVALL